MRPCPRTITCVVEHADSQQGCRASRIPPRSPRLVACPSTILHRERHVYATVFGACRGSPPHAHRGTGTTSRSWHRAGDERWNTGVPLRALPPLRRRALPLSRGGPCLTSCRDARCGTGYATMGSMGIGGGGRRRARLSPAGQPGERQPGTARARRCGGSGCRLRRHRWERGTVGCALRARRPLAPLGIVRAPVMPDPPSALQRTARRTGPRRLTRVRRRTRSARAQFGRVVDTSACFMR